MEKLIIIMLFFLFFWIIFVNVSIMDQLKIIVKTCVFFNRRAEYVDSNSVHLLYWKSIALPYRPHGKNHEICRPQSDKCDSRSLFYSVDGSCNNLSKSFYGRAKLPFSRMLPANYDGKTYNIRMSNNRTIKLTDT